MVFLIKEFIIYTDYRGLIKIYIPKVDYYGLCDTNFNDFYNEEIMYKIPIKDEIILIDEFNYPNNEKTLKNLLTDLDGLSHVDNEAKVFMTGCPS